MKTSSIQGSSMQPTQPLQSSADAHLADILCDHHRVAPHSDELSLHSMHLQSSVQVCRSCMVD